MSEANEQPESSSGRIDGCVDFGGLFYSAIRDAVYQFLTDNPSVLERPAQCVTTIGAPFPWSKMSVRTCNLWKYSHDATRPRTYGEMIQLGRFAVSEMRNAGQTTLNELDETMSKAGLSDEWMSR